MIKERKLVVIKCNFKSNSNETLTVHIGKHHKVADIINCGLCENNFETRENLEIHLNTCEIYRCSKCKKKETTLPNMKDHVINVLDSEKYLMIDNFELSRDNSEVVTWKNLYFGF